MSNVNTNSPVVQTLAEVEKAHLIKVLELYGNNKTHAAKALGITLKSVYNKLNAYGLADQYCKEAPKKAVEVVA